MTVDYRVDPAPSVVPISIGVYRSATADFGPGAEPVGSPVALPATDSAGLPSDGPGSHRVTIPLAGGLPINPEHPYVVVVADPGTPGSGRPGSVASFRKASIAIVSHGGLEISAWKKDGPPWEREMAQSLREQGYDRVIAFNWVAESGSPGAAVRQVPRLTAMILDATAKFPADEPVNLQFIGHSEGAVVNTQTIVRVEAAPDPRIEAGYLEDTLLDPHAANPDFPGRQYSTGGPIGWIAKLAIDNFQARARDPLVFIPKGVDSAQVFYQQTPANRDHGTNSGIYNLWGQVPVKGQASYYNLTPAGAVHSGKQGVYAWYEHHVVPTLGDGAPQLSRDALSASLASPAVAGPGASYSGTAEPGSTVRLSAGKPGGPLQLVARATAAGDGTWTATTTPLAAGTYRVVAESRPADWSRQRKQAIPTLPLGPLEVAR